MPNWNQVLQEIQTGYENKDEAALDTVRRRYISALANHTGRNVICYYSGFLDNSDHPKIEINDADKNGFMNSVHKLNKDLPLDLVLHTPGGSVDATESLVHYLRSMFPAGIRVIVPQIAMSAGTMIACAADSIVMGKQSNLGPIDPHFRGLPCHGVIDEFKTAHQDIKADPSMVAVWAPILNKYHPTFLGDCKHAVDRSEEVVKSWLMTWMFSNLDEDVREQHASKIVGYLNNHSDTKSHGRHIHIEDAIKQGLVIERLEDDPELQDLVLTVHHCYMHTIGSSKMVKCIENNLGHALMNFAN